MSWDPSAWRDSWRGYGAGGGRRVSLTRASGRAPGRAFSHPALFAPPVPLEVIASRNRTPGKHLSQSAHYWARCAWVDGQRSRAQHRETGEPCTPLCPTCPRVLGNSEQLQVGWVYIQASGLASARLRGLFPSPTEPPTGSPAGLGTRPGWGHLEPTGSRERLMSWGPRWVTAAVSFCGPLPARPPHPFLTREEICSGEVSPPLGAGSALTWGPLPSSSCCTNIMSRAPYECGNPAGHWWPAWHTPPICRPG